MKSGSKSGRLPEEEAPACPELESTLLLMDGALAGLARGAALGHARLCDVCGPLVSGWPAIAAGLQAHFEEAAELAKPGLAQMPARVLGALEQERKRRLPSWLRAPAVRFPVYASLGAAAVFVFVMQPLKPAPHPLVVAQRPASVQLPAAAPAQVAPPAPVEAVPENDCHMHQLAFDGADGMVYRTATDGMTVIWVTEHDGA